MIKIEIVNEYEIEKTIIQYAKGFYTVYYYDFEGVMIVEEKHGTLGKALKAIEEKGE